MIQFENLALLSIIDSDIGTYVEEDTKEKILNQLEARYGCSICSTLSSVTPVTWDRFEHDMIEYSKETPTFIYKFHGYTELSTDNLIYVSNGFFDVSVRSYTPNPLDLIHSDHLEAFSNVLLAAEEIYSGLDDEAYPSWLVTAHRFFAIQSGYTSLEAHEEYHRLLKVGLQDIFYKIPYTGEAGPRHKIDFLYYDNRDKLKWIGKSIDIYDLSINQFKELNMTLDHIRTNPLSVAVRALEYVSEYFTSNQTSNDA